MVDNAHLRVRARELARKMIYLELAALEAERREDGRAAASLWELREGLAIQRMAFMRRLYAVRRGRYEAPRQA